MACFVVTAAEAVVVTAVAGVMAHREKKALAVPSVGNEGSKIANEQNEKIRFSKKLMWLANLLWGGAILLAFEHVWHGEVVPFFPFLTAAADPANASRNGNSRCYNVGSCYSCMGRNYDCFQGN